MRTLFCAWFAVASLNLGVGCQINPRIRPAEDPTVFTELSPNMMVSDVNRTVEYYRDILGFAFVGGVAPHSQEGITRYDASQPLAWAMMRQGSVQMMFQSRESIAGELPQVRDTPIGSTATFYIEMPDVRPLHARIRDRVKIVSEPHRTFYGTEEFAVQDCNGYFLWFASRLTEATP